MPVLYDVTAHPMLTAKVTALASGVQTGNQLLAESLLGLVAPAATDPAQVDVIKLAIVLQMNFQVAQGVDPLIQVSAASSHSKESAVWRDRVLNPQALTLIASLPDTVSAGLVDRWETVTSVRTTDDGSA
jgi:hypothetical protein